MTPERTAAAGVATPVAFFYPSLHLNLGEAYRKLGDLSSARTHLRLGQDAAQAFGDDGYARMIRGGLDGLATRLRDRPGSWRSGHPLTFHYRLFLKFYQANLCTVREVRELSLAHDGVFLRTDHMTERNSLPCDR